MLASLVTIHVLVVELNTDRHSQANSCHSGYLQTHWMSYKFTRKSCRALWLGVNIIRVL